LDWGCIKIFAKAQTTYLKRGGFRFCLRKISLLAGLKCREQTEAEKSLLPAFIKQGYKKYGVD
jgi:hypothetical protein